MNSVNLRTPASPHELFILFNETCICLVMQAVYFGVTLTRLFSVTVACWNHLRTRLKNIVLERRFSNLDMQINYLLKGTIQSNRSRVEPDTLHFFFFFFFFNFYFYFILLYNTVLVLPYIDMNPLRGHPAFLQTARGCRCCWSPHPPQYWETGTSSSSIPRKLVKNADSQMQSWTSWVRNLWAGSSNPRFTNPASDSDMC